MGPLRLFLVSDILLCLDFCVLYSIKFIQFILDLIIFWLEYFLKYVYIVYLFIYLLFCYFYFLNSTFVLQGQISCGFILVFLFHNSCFPEFTVWKSRSCNRVQHANF